jgi:hypothetical protein
MLGVFLRNARVKVRQVIAVKGCRGPGQDRSCQR